MWNSNFLLFFAFFYFAQVSLLRAQQFSPIVRIDLHDRQYLNEQQPGTGLFITLDSVTGSGPNVTFSWSLPVSFVSQTYFAILVTRPIDSKLGTNATVFSSGMRQSSSQIFTGLPRSSLSPNTAYNVQVMISGTLTNSSSSTSSWSDALPFFTSAGSAAWSSSAPVWAAKCGSSGDKNPHFALFHADVQISIPAASNGILSALLYATAAPPIYNDPWNVTKLFTGFKLRVNDMFIGIGPGHTACGPYAMSSCKPVQPVDGFDLTSVTRDATKSTGSGSLSLDLTSFGLVQTEYSIVPAVQGVLVVRFSPEGSSPDLVVGSSAGTSSPWLALDADGVFNPRGNKDSGWYTQPREDANLACIPTLPSGSPLSGCPSPYSTCSWSPPVAAPGAFGDYQSGGTLPLSGKATQAMQINPYLRFASSSQLGVGRYLFDPSFELQGGFALNILPAAAASSPNGVFAIIQLSDQLETNGSAMWNTRAGMHYQDDWTFPPQSVSSQPEHQYAEHHEMCEFRYAELILLDPITLAPLDLLPGEHFDAHLWRVNYRYDDITAATVKTTSADLDAVFNLCAFTLKTTSMDIYSDSNTRQRSFDCMADDNVAALSHYTTTTELALPRMMAAQIMSIGEQGYISGNWADWTVIPGLNVVYDALYTGDLTFASSLFDNVLSNHTYAWLVDSSTGLVTADWLGALVDTSGGNDDGFQDSDVNTVVNAWSYLSMRRTAQLGRWLGRTSDAASLDAFADKLQASMKSLMFNGTAMCDGICTKTPHTSVHSTFYSLWAGIADGDDAFATTLAEYVRVRSFEDPVLGVPCGSYPIQFLLAGLYEDKYDHGLAAYRVLTSTTKHSYLNMMQFFGATSTMECWLPEELPNLSFSHVWSSSPSFIIPQFFFGLTPTSPGYATATVRPQPGPVLSGEATIPTVKGPFRVGFTQTVPGGPGGCITVNVGVPGGVFTRVYLPRWNTTVTVTVDGSVAQSTVEGDYAFVDNIQGGEHSVSTC
jgi:hypothetical protein